jgi:arabinogalactan oligomer/maltooligosaccharide transport system substrate-binding protein
MAEGDASQALVSDPSAGADVYLFSNNQIPELVKAIAIAELGGTRVDAIKAANTESCVNTVTYEGGVYGVPFTGNTWFMYFDKSVFTPEDILSLDAMLTKAKVAFPLENSWYLAAFYVAGGCTLFGPDGDDEEAGIDFGGDKAVAVTNYLVDLVKNPNFSSGDVGDHPSAKAFFSGTWDYDKAHDAYGDNVGMAPAPSITLNGELRQLKAFAGSKAIGCNPSSPNYRAHPEIVVELAMHLGSAEAQLRHYECRDVIPSDVNVVVDDELARAQMDTMDYASIVQPLQPNMSNYWAPADSMGQELVVGTVTHANAAAKTEAMNASMNSFVVQ